MAGIHVRFEVTPDQFLANVAQAAYEVALRYGFRAPFDQVSLDLVKAIRKVIQKEMQVCQMCGATKTCCEAPRFAPWSPEALEIFREEDEEVA